MRLMILCVLFVFAGAIWLFPQSTASGTSPNLQVHFLDVGQGDAALIETPSGIQVLVDGGKDSSVLQELGAVMNIGDRKIDMVIGTHPDTDHIGGLIDVFKNYEVATILTTENKGDSQTAELYEELKSAEGAEVVYARRGQTFALDASTTLHVLFPETDPSDLESNASSIVFQLEYGSSTFMFTGDSPKSIEEYLVLSEGEYLQSDVLKVGHHGSRTSTSEMFLDEVAPSIAVISSGKDNSYGHPHLEVTDALFNAGVTILETAVEGTITFASDGIRIWKE
jgi:competence protein ComEC